MDKKYLYIFFSGVSLLSICVIGTCISSISKYNDLNIIQNRALLIPYILSYAFICVGILGIFGLIQKKFK